MNKPHKCYKMVYGGTNHSEDKRALHWRHNDHDGVSNYQPHGCLLNRLFRRRSKKTSKLCVTGLCVGNSPGPVNSPNKGPVTRKMFPFDDVIMGCHVPHRTGKYFIFGGIKHTEVHIDGLVQDCSFSSALATGLLQSYTKPSTLSLVPLAASSIRSFVYCVCVVQDVCADDITPKDLYHTTNILF